MVGHDRDPEVVVETIKRLIPRVPPRYGSYLSVLVATVGTSNREIARYLGISSPSWIARKQHAIRAAQLAASLPDLLPGEVFIRVSQAGHPPSDALVASLFWERWVGTEVGRELGIDQRRVSEALTRVVRSDRPHEIAAAISAIRSWNACGPRRRSRQRARRRARLAASKP